MVPGLTGPLAALDPPQQWGALDPTGAQQVPEHLSPPTPSQTLGVSGDLHRGWLLCMIIGTVKGQAVIGCLWIILLEAGLRLAVRASSPTKAKL